MRSRTPYRIMAGCIILIGVLLQVSPALAGIGVEPTITELELAPGHTITGLFRVANGGKDTTLVNVELEDWLKLRIGESPMEVEDWLTIDETEFELEPGEVKSINYKIMAPKGIEGELVAMVFFSSSVPSGGSLDITSRFGVSVYVGIKGTEVMDAEIEDISVKDSTLGITVKNRGNVHVRPSGKVIIKGSKGNVVDELDIPYMAVIFAGKEHRYPLDLSKIKLRKGDYNIEAVFDTGTIYNKNRTFSKTVSLYIE